MFRKQQRNLFQNLELTIQYRRNLHSKNLTAAPIDIGAYFSGSVTHPNSLRSMVRERRSTNTSTKSVSGIPKFLAARSKVSNLGDALLLNQFDQCLISIPVLSLKSLYDRCKNSSLLTGLQTYITKFVIFLYCVILLDNNTWFTSKVTQTTRHPVGRMPYADLITRRSGFISRIYYEYNLLRDELCHAGRSLRLSWSEGA